MDVSVKFWQSVDRIEASEKGADGVLFFWVGDEARVVKSSSTVVEEFFANRLARVIGLPSPRVTIVEHTSQEWKEIKNAIHRVVDEASGLKHRALAQLKRPTFLVMDFVKNCKEYDAIHPQLATKWMDTTTSEGRTRLWGLGRLAGFDMLINNRDRMPCCWRNEGNLGNVLLCDILEPERCELVSRRSRHSADTEMEDTEVFGGGVAEQLSMDTLLSPPALGLCAIDNVASAILIAKPHSDGTNEQSRAGAIQRRTEQYHKVRLALQGMASDFSLPSTVKAAKDPTSEAYKYAATMKSKLHTFFSYYDLVQLKEDFFIYFAEGLRQFVVDVALHVTQETITDLIEEVKSTVKIDWEGVWAREVQALDEEFFTQMLTVIYECYNNLEEAGVLPAPTVRTVGQPEQDAVDVLLQLKSFSLQGEVKEEESQAGAAREGDGTSGKRYKPSISDRAPASPAKHSDPWASLLQASEDHAATMEASSGLTAGVVELPPQHMYTGRMVKLSRPGSETNLIPSDVPPENLLLSTDDSYPSGRSYLAQLLDAKSESKSSGKCRPEVVNAVAVQCESAPMSRVPTVVEETVQQWCGEAMQRIDLFVFPEDFVDGTGKISLVKNKMLARVAAIAHRFKTYILLGTMMEGPNISGSKYKTAVLLGPSGDPGYPVQPLEEQSDGGGLWGYYRKQKPVPGEKVEPGNLPGVIETGSPRLGAIGVLICYDAEDDDILQRLMKQDITLLVNPCYITQRGQASYMSWVVAASGVIPRLSYYSRAHGIPILRVDGCQGDGSGCSALVTPHYSALYPEPGLSSTSFAVPVMVANPPDEQTVSSTIPESLVGATVGQLPFDEARARERTRTYDNIGSRYVKRQLKVPPGYTVTDVLFVAAHAPKPFEAVRKELQEAAETALLPLVEKGFYSRLQPPNPLSPLKHSIATKIEEVLVAILVAQEGSDAQSGVGAWEPGTGQWLGWVTRFPSLDPPSAQWCLLPVASQCCWNASFLVAKAANSPADGSYSSHQLYCASVTGTLADIKSDFSVLPVSVTFKPTAPPPMPPSLILPPGHTASGEPVSPVAEWRLQGSTYGLLLEGKPKGAIDWCLEHVFPEPLPATAIAYSPHMGCIGVVCTNPTVPPASCSNHYSYQTLQIITVSQNYEKRRLHDILLPRLRH